MESPDATSAPAPVLTVSRLVASARLALERQLGVVWVQGEVSNLHRAGSGHVYFTLKDATAQVRCALWRSKAQLVDFPLENGQAVEVRGICSIYEPRGEFQLAVDAMRRAGLGALYERFLKLRARLEAEGLLAPERKRPLPRVPRAVGVVSSTRGAALHDVLVTLARRWPRLRVVVYPTAVQGPGAGAEVARAIALASRRAETDVLILCRGGGSIEDLWAFNEEVVARAIVASRIPVVAGIGHETDVTIADLAADRRAPTPTGAATLVCPDIADECRRAEALARRLARAADHLLATAAQRTDAAARRLVHPSARLEAQRMRVGELALRLARSLSRQHAARVRTVDIQRLRLARELRDPARRLPQLGTLAVVLRRAARLAVEAGNARVLVLAQNLEHLNPQAVLERGYAIVVDATGDVVSDAASLSPGDDVALTLAHGRASARITGKDHGG